MRDFKGLDVKVFGTLHEVVDQLKNTIVYKKHEGYQTECLPADVSLLCAALPGKERIETGSTLGDRYGLHSGILCKFEPIFVLKDDQVNAVEKDTVSAEYNKKPIYGEEFIRKYVAYARLNCKPELPEEYKSVILDRYMTLRNRVKYVAGRQFETLLRLAEASARSRLSDTIDLCDIKRSFAIFDDYLLSVGAEMREESSIRTNDGCDGE